MSHRPPLMAVVASVLFAAMASPHATRAAEMPLGAGDSVVTVDRSPVKAGSTTLLTVGPGTRLHVVSVKDNWVAVAVDHEGKQVKGWIDASHLRVVDEETPSEPIVMRLDWRPGDYYRYTVSMECDVTAAGEADRATMRATTGVELRVVQQSNAGLPTANPTASSETLPSPAFSLEGQHVEVEQTLDEIVQEMTISGSTFRARITEDSVSADVDGRALPSYEMSELRSEVKPVQDLLRARVRTTITDSGRVVRVSGLEDLDADAQRELAGMLLDGMVLPEEPLRVGESFTDSRKLETLLPQQPGGGDALAGRTVDGVWTLEAIRRDRQGHRIARMSGIIKGSVDNVPIDEDGHMGSIEFDIKASREFDMYLGTVVEEHAAGTVTLRPDSGYGLPSRISVDVEATSKLAENRRVARASGSLADRTGGTR